MSAVQAGLQDQPVILQSSRAAKDEVFRQHLVREEALELVLRDTIPLLIFDHLIANRNAEDRHACLFVAVEREARIPADEDRAVAHRAIISCRSKLFKLGDLGRNKRRVGSEWKRR